MKPHIKKVRGAGYWTCDGIIGLSPWLAYMMWERWGPNGEQEDDYEEVS